MKHFEREKTDFLKFIKRVAITALFLKFIKIFMGKKEKNAFL